MSAIVKSLLTEFLGKIGHPQNITSYDLVELYLIVEKHGSNCYNFFILIPTLLLNPYFSIPYPLHLKKHTLFTFTLITIFSHQRIWLILMSVPVHRVILVTTVNITLMTAKDLHVKTMELALIRSMLTDVSVVKVLMVAIVRQTLMTVHPLPVAMEVGCGELPFI